MTQTPEHLSDELLSRLSEFVAARMGLDFPRERWRDLERGIRSAALAEGGRWSVAEYATWILAAPLTRSQVETLASEFTVGETYFFREYRSFEVLSETVLPELIARRRETGHRLRIWSAGCCTGEEAYSIAILLDRNFPE
ncbi:MAG TPA: CheR family methyltransferase, partial [Chthoniobacteraceae bacterium]|nr:CheR family methyltransferase [Chthoniobacteraceae bacterium]